MRTSFYFPRYHYIMKVTSVFVGSDVTVNVLVRRRDGDITSWGTKRGEVKRGNGVLMTGWKMNKRTSVAFLLPNMVNLTSLTSSTLFVR